MKGVYWRSKNVSRSVLILIAVTAIGGLLAVESFKVKVKQANIHEKIKAAKHMEECMQELRKLRAKLNVPIDHENDPTGSGLIGWPISSLTSNTGYLDSKQTTINPNFAAVVVHYLKKIGVKKGDVIAVGFSGSFPALNIAVLSACKVLEIEPLIISSAAGSEWGANIPGFTWLEMEKYLYDMGKIDFRSIAASIGGVGDKGQGMPKEGREMLRRLIEEDPDVAMIWPKNLTDGVDQRMQQYEIAAGGRPIKAYVNVGGGTVSVGTVVGKRLFKPGVTRKAPAAPSDIDSVMLRFAQAGVPVVHFTQIKKLATKFGLPAPPLTPQKVGQGNIYYQIEYNKWLVGVVLAVLVLLLWLLVRMNLAGRFSGRAKKVTDAVPEPMV